MALKPCRECGKLVAEDASTCPQCGAGTPVRTLTGDDIIALLLPVLSVGGLLYAWLSGAMD